ncbi:MAG: ribonuclease PH [Rhodobacterales bacterium]|jgi:ribonuclease PH|nr:MAG: ribonuclease PH [Rhodobacterales bacterium]|tara:strand:+ start:492 stop:1211 length:720 start_codon:yes stop_codon:yes gene_type:complete
MRPSNRNINQIRPVSIKTDIIKNAEGSCNIKCGNTEIICTATIDENVPHFIRKTGLGWVTAEYGMLPRSTNSRMKRESSRGKQGGRTLEIQRLIGRSLRTCVDRLLLGERQIIIDCDVIQADGGTRCAAITGGWIALKLASDHLVKNQIIDENPIINQVAAISCGIYNDEPILDLDYEEDSNVKTDANFVLNQKNEIIEIQVSAEKDPFSYKDFEKLFELSKGGIEKLIDFQSKAIKSE